MRPTLAFLALTLIACGPGYSPEMPLGDRSIPVAIVDCLEPQRGLIAEQVASYGWHISDAGEVTVRCADLGEGGGAGSYTLGATEVRVDPAKAPGLAIRQAAGHELVHWRLWNGPRPDSAKLHICDLAFNETAGPGCAPSFSAKNALMSPGLGGSVSDETFGALAEYRVTEEDRRFIEWALTQ